MKSFGKLVVVIALIAIGSIILAINSDATETTLVMDSDSGDDIGGGLVYFYTTVDGTFTAQHNNVFNGVSISFHTPNNSHFWNLDFAAPDNGPLTVGTYSSAMRFPFQNPGVPGLSVYGDGRGCNTSVGSFEIKQVTYGTTNDIVAFWATFEQHCEGAAPALRGEIRFNANAPDTTTVISSTFNPSIIGQPVTFTATVLSATGTPTGNVSFMDESVALGTGLLAGNPATATFTTSSLSVGTHRLTALYGGSGNFSSSISAVLNQTVEQTNATVLIMNSDPEDYIGRGLRYSYTIADGTFTAQHNNGNGVSISFHTPNSSHFWNLDFAAPNNGPLTVGTYSDAMRFPFQNPGVPGLSVYGDGRGCNTSVGSFEIKQVTYGTTNDIVAFWATFEQHCEGAAPALRGEIRFNANVDVLTITKTGTGNGDVTANSETINWSGNSGTATYDSNTSVTLTASASNGSTFTSWSGCDATNGNQCTLTMNTDRSVTAIFTLARYTLTIAKSGTGNGGITSSPSGIDCGSICSAKYDKGKPITLTAQPDQTSVFIPGWSGGGCTGTGACVLTLNADITTTATFTAVQSGTPKISIEPTSLNFGSLKVGSTSDPKTITVKNTGKGSLIIDPISVTGTNADEFPQTNSCTIISPGGSCTIPVTFTPTSPFGKKSAIINISSNDPKKPAVKVKLSGQAPPPKISFFTKSVDFGSVPVGNLSVLKIGTIKNTGISDLEINDINITGANAGEFSQRSGCKTIPKSGSCTLYVIFTPTSPFGKKSAIINISSNDPKKPAVKVKLSGQAPPPKISFSPKSVDFGSVPVGNLSISKIGTIKNTGISDLEINDINITGANAGEFSQTSGCRTIPKGGSCTLYVKFTPVLTGKKSASIDISSNDPKKPIINMKLSGTGI